MKKIRKNKENGITLIALVITIIVLLILAGVTIATLTGENGILNQAERAKETTETAGIEEKQQLQDLENLMKNLANSEEGYDPVAEVNKPKLSSGMIPVKWNGSAWEKANESNKNFDWYQYGTTNETKKWGNIVTVKASGTKTREEYENAEVGTKIEQDDITTMFVWIPRYSYKIVNGYQTPNEETPTQTNNNENKNIEITFLKGNTNTGTDGITYNTDGDTSKEKIVHPGFTMNGAELTGIWVAKFEASGLNSNGDAVGNVSATNNTPTPVDSTTYVRILPNQISWREIQVGECQYQSMQMSIDKNNNYGWNSVNAHLIKNDEWGAVAYMCYSQYGNVPMTNGSMSFNNSTLSYNVYTGAGPNTSSDESWYGLNNGTVKNGGEFTESAHGYSTSNGVLSSTTGNVYGIYDMAGGAYEIVAGYLDNGNSYLETYGNSTSNSDAKYFKRNGKTNRTELDPKYSAYWNSYEVSEEENNNQIVVEGIEKTFTQAELWNESLNTTQYNATRYRITGITYQNMAKHKGIGVNETSKYYSHYIAYNNGSKNMWGWSKAETGAWNSDNILIGHIYRPFIARGGYAEEEANAGILTFINPFGSGYGTVSFRPTLAF